MLTILRPSLWRASMMARRRAVGLSLVAACVLATALPLPAQQPVRIVGAVQWVSSTSMAGEQ